ncbi:porin family protein [Chryseosolibacter indicus]|uniref:Outer membrane beta-barrel protein n=1 Tax=Chryseosolibacter indicus TaxID=2782351 RepID=A0ABS5VK98_9BACT|nr:porin family protein [Chryseosolibacter indicus]MBT1701862.1 outer membrane beta-barrel protein [Chryseosolibacter indicus]
MKTKLSLLIVTICLAASHAYSQAEFAIGIKAGPNFASLDTKASAGENYKSRTGFHGGAFALIKLSKIGIQPEIIFSQQGSKVEFNGADIESNYNYMNVPIILKLYTIAGINIQAGPQFGFITKAEETFDYNGDTTTEDIKNQLKGSDISLGLGLGWDLPFGLTIDGRYNLGLSKINDAPDRPEAKNQVWQFSVGYKLFKFGN